MFVIILFGYKYVNLYIVMLFVGYNINGLLSLVKKKIRIKKYVFLKIVSFYRCEYWDGYVNISVI